MALRMAVALTSTSSLSEWVSLAQNVAAAPLRDQVLGRGWGVGEDGGGGQSVGGHPIFLTDLNHCGVSEPGGRGAGRDSLPGCLLWLVMTECRLGYLPCWL